MARKRTIKWEDLFERAWLEYERQNKDDLKDTGRFFQFMMLNFDLLKAQMLIEQRGAFVSEQYIDVEQYANTYGFKFVQSVKDFNDGKISTTHIPLIDIDHDRAMALPLESLSSDLLIGTMRFPSDNKEKRQGEINHTLIDGWHRLYRAWKEGCKSMSVIILSEVETNAILVQKPEWTE